MKGAWRVQICVLQGGPLSRQVKTARSKASAAEVQGETRLEKHFGEGMTELGAHRMGSLTARKAPGETGATSDF